MEKKIKIPESINDITLGQYQKLINLSEKDLDEYSLKCHKVEIVTGLVRHELEHISELDFNSISNQIDEALAKDGSFKNVFTLNGIDFGLIPNFDKITSKEYFDLSTYGVEVENLDRVMAILYRPIVDRYKDTYKIENYNGTERYHELMKQMPLSYVNGALGFFLTLQKDLKNYFQRFTMEAQARGNQHQTTLRSGVGMQRLIHWLRVKFGVTNIF